MKQLQEEIRAELKIGRIYQVTDSSAYNLFITRKIDKPEEARFLHNFVDRNKNTNPNKTMIPDILSIIWTIAPHPVTVTLAMTRVRSRKCGL